MARASACRRAEQVQRAPLTPGSELGTISSLEVGELVGLLAAMAWGATGLLVRAFGAGIHAVVINAFRNAISGLVFVTVWFFASRGQPVPAAAWLLLVASTLM